MPNKKFNYIKTSKGSREQKKVHRVVNTWETICMCRWSSVKLLPGRIFAINLSKLTLLKYADSAPTHTRICWGFVGCLLRICWLFVEGLLRVCWGFVEGLLRVCWVFVEGLLRVCWRFVERVCWGFVQGLLRGFVEGLLRVCWGFLEDVCWGFVEGLLRVRIAKAN